MNPAHLGNIEERLLRAKLWPWRIHPERKMVIAMITREGLEKDGKIVNKQAARIAFRSHLGNDQYASLGGALDIVHQAPGCDDDTLKFIAHAPEDVEAMVTAVRALQLQTERDRANLEQLQQENGRLREALAASEKANKEHNTFMSILKDRLREVVS